MTKYSEVVDGIEKDDEKDLISFCLVGQLILSVITCRMEVRLRISSFRLNFMAGGWIGIPE